MRTVAIPALGTGALNFPADVVASCMFNECDKFSAKHPQSQTTVSEVRLVVYEKDQSTFDVCLTTSVVIYDMFVSTTFSEQVHYIGITVRVGLQCVQKKDQNVFL